MQISDSQKLILFMLTEIYEALEVKSEVDPAFIRDAIWANKTWTIGEMYPGIFNSNTGWPAVAREVADILDMWHIIEDSYSKLETHEKSSVEEKAGRPIVFGGFDGNYERDHKSTAEFLTEKMGRFESFKGRIGDTHCEILGHYRRMCEVFKPLRTKLADRRPMPNLTADEIVGLVTA
jgi:uncharacterized protein YfbU (UPF0304 family)